MAIPEKPTLTTPPTAPVRGEDRASFASKANAYVAFIGTNVTDLTAAIDWQNTVFTAVESEAADAADSAVTATTQAGLATAQADISEAAAAAAVITANAAAWVSGASYSANENAISGIGFGTYRAILTHTGVTTDPSADPTNWVKISAQALTAESTAGASQSIDFSKSKIVKSTAASATVTYSFVNPSDVSKVDLIIDYQAFNGFVIADASYDNTSFSVASQEANPTGLAFKDDGSKMYILGSGSDSIYQYSLSTAWAVETASYDSVSFSVAGQDNTPNSIAFKSDGTKMYIVGSQNYSVYQYSLSTAWDLGAASYDSVSFSVAGQEYEPTAIIFKPDGTKMYVNGIASDNVNQYSLSTAWDLSTASFDSVTLAVGAQENSVSGIAFNSDGTKLFTVGFVQEKVFQYGLTTGYDLSTGSYDNVSFSVAAQDGSPEFIFFKTDGKKMYIVGGNNDSVFQYTSGQTPTLIFPTVLQSPSIPLASGKKTAVTIVTTDGGTSYQVISTLGGIV